MVIYPIAMVYETTNQSLMVTAGMPYSLKRMVMSSTEFSYAAAASEKCFNGGQHQKCIPTVYTHTHTHKYIIIYIYK